MSTVGLPYAFRWEDHPVLYHYTSLTAPRAMLSSQTFWLSDYASLNDTSEYVHARDRLLAMMSNREVYLDLTVRVLVIAALTNMERSTRMMIGSLTSRRDDLNQWRLYGDNTAGCVLGLDARFLQEEAGVAIRSIVYDPKRSEALLKAGLTILQDGYEAEPENHEELTTFANHLIGDFFAIKHPAFADEREVRICRMLVRDAEQLMDVGGNTAGGAGTPVLRPESRSAAFGMAPYVALPVTKTDGSSAIISMGFGPMVSDAAYEAEEASMGEHGMEIWRSALPFRRRNGGGGTGSGSVK